MTFVDEQVKFLLAAEREDHPEKYSGELEASRQRCQEQLAEFDALGPMAYGRRRQPRTLIAAMATVLVLGAATAAIAARPPMQSIMSKFAVFSENDHNTDPEDGPRHERELSGAEGVPKQFGTLQGSIAGRTLLASTDSRWSARIWATSTTNDSICFYVASHRTAGGDQGERTGTCVSSLPSDFPAVVIRSRSRAGTTIGGIMTDRVESVRVRIEGGAVREASLGANAFFWGGIDPSERPLVVELLLRDGSTARRTLPSRADDQMAIGRADEAADCALRFNHPPPC